MRGGGTTSEPLWLRRVVGRAGYRAAGRRFLAGPAIEDAVATASALREAGVASAFLPLFPAPRCEVDLWNLEAALAELVRQAAWRGVEPHLVLEDAHLGGGPEDASPGLPPESGTASLERVVEVVKARGGFVYVGLSEEGALDRLLPRSRASSEDGGAALGFALPVRLRRESRRVVRAAEAGMGLLLHDSDRTLAERPLPGLTVREGARAVREFFLSLAREAWARAMSVAALSRDTATLSALGEAADEAGAARRYEIVYRLGDRVAHLLRVREAGRAVRVLVPFGPDWVPYLTARLAEWPWDAGARPTRA